MTGEFRVLNILKDYPLNRNLPKVTVSPYNAHSVNTEQKQMYKQTNKQTQNTNLTKPQLTISNFFLEFALVIEDLFPNDWE